MKLKSNNLETLVEDAVIDDAEGKVGVYSRENGGLSLVADYENLAELTNEWEDVLEPVVFDHWREEGVKSKLTGLWKERQ